jgi:hypothetical protein
MPAGVVAEHTPQVALAVLAVLEAVAMVVVTIRVARQQVWVALQILEAEEAVLVES